MIKRTKSIDLDAKQEQANPRIVESTNSNIKKVVTITQSKVSRKFHGESNDSIYESQQRGDRVHDLDQGIDHRSIQMTQQPQPDAIKYNSNKLVATANVGMRGTKIPPSILQSIAKLASGKKPAESMTTSKISKAIFQKYREVKGNTFICDICAMEYKEEDRQKISKCAHSFCDSCLRHYVDYKISRFEEVLCPSEDCPEIMDTEGAFYKSLTDQHKQKYKKVHAFSVVAKNPNSRLCPNQKCKQGILYMEQQKNPKCDKCGKVYCSKCLFPEHAGPCQSNQIDFFQNNLHFRQCTNCKSVVQKTVGCNHIKCRCNYQFCYLCGAKWLNYEHRCNSNNNNAQPVAQPAYQNNDNCCDCDCLQGQNCCQLIVKFFLKVLLFPLFLFGVAFVLFIIVAILSLLLGLTLMMGVFPYTCEFICDLGCPMTIVAFILYPLSMLIGIGKAFGDFFCEAARDLIRIFCQAMENWTQCVLCW